MLGVDGDGVASEVELDKDRKVDTGADVGAGRVRTAVAQEELYAYSMTPVPGRKSMVLSFGSKGDKMEGVRAPLRYTDASLQLYRRHASDRPVMK